MHCIYDLDNERNTSVVRTAQRYGTHLDDDDDDDDTEAVVVAVDAADPVRVLLDIGVLERVGVVDGVVVRVPVHVAVPDFVLDVDAVPVDVCVVVSVPVPDGRYHAVLMGANATPRKRVPLAAVAIVVMACVAGAYLRMELGVDMYR